MAENSSPLACIILAAGQGTRMRSSMAKVLHGVAGFPMIQHVRRTAEKLAPQQIVGVIGPDAADVEAALKPHHAAVQKDRLGTAHAVRMAEEKLKNFKGRVLVMYGDTPLITPATLKALVSQPTPVSVLAFRPADAAQYGRVIVNATGQVERIVEFADADTATRAVNLCNAGVMAFDAPLVWELLGAITPQNAKGEFYLTDAVALARGRGMPVGFIEAGTEEVMGVNSRVELAVAEATLQQRLRTTAMENGVTLQDPASVYFCADTQIAVDVIIGPNVVFGPGVVVETGVEILPFSHLEGVTVKKGARIGPFARLRPGSIVGEGAHIGNFVELKKATVEAEAKIGHLTYIGDARVGARSNIGAGTITCNYDGTSKHFTDIGADVFVGSDSALVAPVKIGDGAFVAAGSTITDDVPADAMAVARERQITKKGWAKRYRSKKTAQ